MRPASRVERVTVPAPGPDIPLLESADLPDDNWALSGGFLDDDEPRDDDRYASLVVAQSFDD